MQRLFSVSVVGLLISLFLTFLGVSSSSAARVNPQEPAGPSSTEAPIGYQPSRVQLRSAADIGGSDILLVQTSLPWNSDANTQVLTGLGYTYDIVDMGSIGNVDIFRYPVMLIVNDQVQAFYDQYADQVDRFENYVSNGGTLVFFAASDGWAGGTLRASLPGGVRVTTPWYQSYNYIVETKHPIVTGSLSNGIALGDNDLYGNACTHGYFYDLPEGTKVILREENGYPTLIEYRLGNGRVIASTQTWEFHYIYFYGEFARKALDDVFLHAFSQSGVIDGLFNISPSSVPADGITPINVTLAGIEPGHQVRLSSSRGSLDSFEATTGVADAQGRFSTQLRSSTPGESIFSAQDLTAKQTLPTSIRAKFSSVNPDQPELPPARDTGIVEVLNVSAEHDLQGLYPVGLGKIENEIRVTVDWGGKTPGTIVYQFNNQSPVIQMVDSQYAKRVFDFNSVLREGTNTLTIKARAQDGTESEPRSYTMIGWTAELGWLQPLLASLPYVGPDKVEFILHIPGDPLEALGKTDIWLPGKPTKLGPQAVGKLSIPLRGGRYELGIGARFERDKSIPGRKPWYGRGAFTLLGKNDLEVDFLGSVEGNLSTTSPYLSRPDLFKIAGKAKVTIERDESVVVVIQPLAPAGPIIVSGLKAIPPVYDWVKDRAKFYIKLTPELGGDLTLNWGDQDLRPYAANLYAQMELEGGIKIDVYVAEGKVYLGGGSRIDWGLVPDFGMDKWVFYGMAGYEL